MLTQTQTVCRQLWITGFFPMWTSSVSGINDKYKLFQPHFFFLKAFLSCSSPLDAWLNSKIVFIYLSSRLLGHAAFKLQYSWMYEKCTQTLDTPEENSIVRPSSSVSSNQSMAQCSVWRIDPDVMNCTLANGSYSQHIQLCLSKTKYVSE